MRTDRETGFSLSSEKKPTSVNRLMQNRRSDSYARKLFSRSWQTGETSEDGDAGDEISAEAVDMARQTGKMAGEEGARLISRFYQRAGIKREYETIRRGLSGADPFTGRIRMAAEWGARRLKNALNGERIAGRITALASGRGHLLLLFGAVFLSLTILVGSLASVPLLLQGGTAIAVQNVSHYEIPPEYLSDEKFARMIAEGEKYLGYPYVWGGDSPLTGFDCSGFVSWVINHCGNGWYYGRLVASELLGICTVIPAEEAKPGDLVFFQGTYDTAGASHLGIYVGDSMMLHCGDPIQYTRIDNEYWRQHFLCYGRLPEP